MAAGKFHINRENGTVGACSAKPGNCPLGEDNEHYTSLVAAAKAYEDSMEGNVFTKAAKPKAKKDEKLFELERPDSYRFRESNQALQEEVNKLGYPGKNIYGFIRTEVGPALTHSDANNIMYSWKKNYDAPGGIERWNKLIEDKGASDTYSRVREYILGGSEGVYGDVPSAEELQENLVDNAVKAISAKRNYGFPEDEMTRYYQDKKEKEYIAAISELSGEGEREVRMKLLSKVPVSRPHDGLSQASVTAAAEKLRNRIPTLKNPNLIRQRKQELAEYDRELALRELQRLSKNDAWAQAQKSPNISRKDALGILGAPSKQDLRAMDDDTRGFFLP